MPRRFIITAAVAVALAVLVGVGFLAWIGTDRGLVPVRADSPNAEGIRDLYVFVGAFASAIFLVVTIPLALFAIRFRAGRRRRDEEGPQIRGHTNLELAWTVGPILILVAIATFTFVKLGGIDNAPAAGGAGPLRVEVSGRQFYWQFTYEDSGVIAINHLRLPVSRVADLTITAPSYDVIHSWWVPALGGKRDAIPGMTNHTWVEPERTGTYEGRCAEFCGLQHALMTADVEVMPAADFDAWLSRESQAQRAGTSQLGAQIFDGVCAKCHGDEGQGGYARAIAGNALFNDRVAVDQLLRNGTRNGTREMPAVGKDWSKEEMDAAYQYLHRTLGPQTGGATGGS